MNSTIYALCASVLLSTTPYASPVSAPKKEGLQSPCALPDSKTINAILQHDDSLTQYIQGKYHAKDQRICSPDETVPLIEKKSELLAFKYALHFRCLAFYGEEATTPQQNMLQRSCDALLQRLIEKEENNQRK